MAKWEVKLSETLKLEKRKQKAIFSFVSPCASDSHAHSQSKVQANDKTTQKAKQVTHSRAITDDLFNEREPQFSGVELFLSHLHWGDFMNVFYHTAT